MIILHNPTTNNVRDYPIQDPATKEVKLWSIDSGETLEFPDFVGKYLLEVYGFLQRVVTQEQVEKENEEKKRIDSGMKFSQVKVVTATPINTTPVEKPKGFTNEVVKTPAGTKIQKPKVEKPQDEDVPSRSVAGQTRVVPEVTVEGVQGIACADINCKERFASMEEMKAHYGGKHLEFEAPPAN